MRKILFVNICALVLAFYACGNSHKDDTAAKEAVQEPAEAVDSMIYGLSCDGTNEREVVFLPFSGGDPLTFSIEDARLNGRIIGQPKIGDWVGIMVNPADSSEVTMLVDLDQLKGTWTFQVMPTWKDASKMSKRALRRKMAELPDSLREQYIVPREYGFSLKRSGVASPVGYVMRQSSLEDDSPVEYPAVKNYQSWRCRNGRLVLGSTLTRNMSAVSTTDDKDKKVVKPEPQTYDTLNFVSMTDDSLLVTDRTGRLIGFHRKENAMKANAEAQKAAQKISDKNADKLK